MAISKACLAQSQPNKAHRRAVEDPEAFKRRAERRMAEVDALPLAWRLLVHEFGWLRVKCQRERTTDVRKAFIALSLPQVDLDL